MLEKVYSFGIWFENHKAFNSKAMKMNHLLSPKKSHFSIPFYSLILKFSIFLFFPVIISAQGGNPKFRHITLEDGLSNSLITCIYQDSLGFIWIGTENGLHKYDGYKLQVFRHIPGDTSSLTNHSVTSIVEDQMRNLWVSTKFGLNRLDLETEQIQQIIQLDPTPNTSKVNFLGEILFDPFDRTLWIISEDGLLKFPIPDNDVDLSKITSFHFPGADSLSVRSLLIDTGGDLWIGTTIGLVKYDRNQSNQNKFEFVQTDNKYDVFDMEEDAFGYIWFSIKEGINNIHKDSLGIRPQKVNLSHIGDFKNHSKITLFKDRSNKVWAGTNFGLLELKSSNEVVLKYQKDKSNPYSLLSHQFGGLCQDQADMLWIGTHSGINLLSAEDQGINHYRLPYTSEQGDEVFFVRSLLEDYAGATWIGTQNAGLFQLEEGQTNPRPFELQQYDLEGNDVKFNGFIAAIVEDKTENIWLGTLANGLIKINRKEKKVRRISFPSELKIQKDEIGALCRDQSGGVWIGTPSHLIQFNARTQSFHPYQYAPQNEINIRTITQDSAGIIWIGTLEHGLFKFDPNSDESRKKGLISIPIPGPDTINNGYKVINQILVDDDEMLWIATYGSGLVKMDTQRDRFYFFNSANTELPDDIIYGILKDKQGHIWLSSNKGISSFFPKDSSVWTLDYRDGLQSNEFNSGACHQAANGKMYFGGINGYNTFYPNQVKKSRFIPPIVFTDFLIDNKSVQPGEDAPLKRHISYTDAIVLNYRQSNISFEVAALDYYIPEKNQFAYMLEGYDEDWIYISNRRFFNYTNLKPGTYTLRVKGSNHDGVWNEGGTRLQIIICPPWFWNALSKTIYTLVLLGIFYLFYRFQLIRQLAKKEVELAKKEAVRLKELDEARTKFYTKITHEFRTPLTIISGMADQINEHPEKDTEEATEMIQRNSNELLYLVNELLELSKLKVGAMKLNLIKGDIMHYLRYIFESFHSYAKNKGIQTHFLSSMEKLTMDYDTAKLQKVIYNLTSNALKFTPENGNIYLQADRELNDEKPFLKIRLKDTGIGIPKEHQPFIFTSFYQVDDSATRKEKGTGIGLAVVKELVQLMKGQINVTSELNKGTEFQILLPITTSAKPGNIPSYKTEAPGRFPKIIKSEEIEMERSYLQAEGMPQLLIIEDNPDVRLYLKTCLEKDYLLEFAQNGQVGIEKALKNVPDIIISDVMMPEKDGLEVCNTLKNNPGTSHVPIILLTAKVDIESRLAGLEKGADVYLEKPFNKQELLIRLEKLIEKREKLREKYQSYVSFMFFNETEALHEDSFIIDLLAIIKENISDPDFKIEGLCREIGLSRSQLFRKTKALIGQPPSLIIKDLRLDKARFLIKTTALNISEIAYQEVGYTSLSHFSDDYFKKFGERPSDTHK